MTSDGTKSSAVNSLFRVFVQNVTGFRGSSQDKACRRCCHWSGHLGSASPLSNHICLRMKQRSPPAVRCTPKGKSPAKPVRKDLWEGCAAAVRLRELPRESHRGRGGASPRLVSSISKKGFQPSPPPDSCWGRLPSSSLCLGYCYCSLTHFPVFHLFAYHCRGTLPYHCGMQQLPLLCWSLLTSRWQINCSEAQS